jgi:methionyl-tRNA formyltransferase
MRETRAPLHEAALRHGLDVRTPASLRDAEVQAAFAALAPDAAVVIAYGLILPRAILAVPRLGCLNVHPSLLPRWRGAAPVARAIEAGDAETGVAIMQMDEGLDSGPVLACERLPMPPDATTPTLETDLAHRGARLLVEALDALAAGHARPRPQPSDGITYARKLGRDEGRIDWREPAVAIERRVRAFQPWPGAAFRLADGWIKVLESRLADGSGAPGTLLDDRLTVACGEGALRLGRVQRAGRPPTDGAAFLRGARLAPGAVLG